MSKSKKIIIVLPLLAALGVGGYLWRYALSRERPDHRLTVYGNIELRDAQLAFKEQERIAEVLVEEGVGVEKGQVLARLEDDRLVARMAEAQARLAAQQEVLRRLTTGTRPQEIEKAEAQLAAARVRVRNAERLVRRLDVTSRTGASTRQDLDDARAELDVARAQMNVSRESLDLAREGFREEEIAEARALVKMRQAQVDFLGRRLEDTVLRAPAKGVIQSRILEPGEIATPSRPIFSLALTDPKWVRAYLPEPDLGRINRGMHARIHSDSFTGRAFDGWVGFIAPQAEFTPKSVQTTELRTQLVYETRIWVTDPANELRLGMPVTVEIDTCKPDAREQARIIRPEAGTEG